MSLNSDNDGQLHSSQHSLPASCHVYLLYFGICHGSHYVCLKHTPLLYSQVLRPGRCPEIPEIFLQMS